MLITWFRSFRCKRALVFLFILILILIFGSGCDRFYPPTTYPTEVASIAPSPTSLVLSKPTETLPTPTDPTLTLTLQSLDEITPTVPEKILSIPLGIGVYDSEDVDFFNRFAVEQDVIAVRSEYLSLLDRVRTGQKKLILSPHDRENLDISALINEAKGKGVTILGFNLETALSQEELIDQEIQMKSLAQEAGLLYVFGPTLQKLSKFYLDFAPHSDILVLQSQRFQTTADYEQRVEQLISNIKSANPKVKVWVQVSVIPPEKRDATADEIVSDIKLIADHADLVLIYFTPKTASVMEEVILKLRQP